MTTTPDDVLEVLRSASRPLKAREIASILGHSKETKIPRAEINRHLYKIKSTGKVTLDPEYRWHLVKTPASGDSKETQGRKKKTASSTPVTYYDTLQVSRHAHPRVVERAYKVLVGLYHPDRGNPSERKDLEEKMKLINQAYEVLSDEQKRKRYDEHLQEHEC